MLPVSLRGPPWHVSAASTAQRDLMNCQTRLPHTQGWVSLQFPSLASQSVGKRHDSRLREELPRPLSGHTPPAHTEPPRPLRPALQTLMRVCSALDPPTTSLGVVWSLLRSWSLLRASLAHLYRGVSTSDPTRNGGSPTSPPLKIALEGRWVPSRRPTKFGGGAIDARKLMANKGRISCRGTALTACA